MIETIQLLPGIVLRCCPDDRFKQACLSIAIVRPMCRREASANALLPAVLLRGTRQYPDLRAITMRLDDLYGAAVGTQVRRIGDYQTTGLYCGFMEEKYALDGDRVIEPMADFLRQLLLDPVLENDGFCADFVAGEKRNLLSAMEAQRNDKRLYAAEKLMEHMCREDSFGIPRLGQKEDVQALNGKNLYDHYRKILRESQIELFYVGASSAETVAALVRPIFLQLERDYRPLPPQSAFRGAEGSRHTETMDVAQGKLCMGFVTPVTLRDPDFVPMQVFNTLYGSSMTSKLFMQVREKLSLCYDIGSSYHGSKGIISVAAGIDCAQEQTVRAEVLRQLEECRLGHFTQQEFNAARQALLSSLRSIHDTPGSIENFYATAALSGLPLTPQQYMQAVSQVQLHTEFFLKGVQ